MKVDIENVVKWLKDNTHYRRVERISSFGYKIDNLELFCDFDTQEEMIETFRMQMESMYGAGKMEE